MKKLITLFSLLSISIIGQTTFKLQTPSSVLIPASGNYTLFFNSSSSNVPYVKKSNNTIQSLASLIGFTPGAATWGSITGTVTNQTDLISYLGSNYWKAGGNTFGVKKKIGTSDNFDLPFITNGVERMRLTTTGYFGVGTDSPSYLFDGRTTEQTWLNLQTVSGFGQFQVLFDSAGGTGLYIGNITNHDLRFYTNNGTGTFIVKAAGKIQMDDSVQINDGTQGTNKFLQCVDANGNSVWSNTLTGATINSATVASPVITGTVTGSPVINTPTITSPTLTGTAIGVTPSFGAKNTQLATTAFVKQAMDTTLILTGSDATTTSTVAATVGTFSYTGVANAVYQIDASFITGCSGTGGMNFSFTFPGSSTGIIAVHGMTSAITSFIRALISNSAPAPTQVFNNVVNTGFAYFSGLVTMDGSGGVFSINFNSATGGQTSTVYSGGSYVTIKRVK